MKKLIRQLENSHDSWIAITILLTFFILRLPSLFEPYWYGDEGIYETIGLALTNGRTLYTQIWDNKPPLLYLTYALVHGSQFLVRFLSLFAGLVTIPIFYLLAKKLFTNKLAASMATLIFAILFGLPTFEGNIANAENFMLLPIVLAGLLVYSSCKKILTRELRDLRPIILAGFILGIAVLYKVVAIFDFSAFFLFLLIATYEKGLTLTNIVNYIKRTQSIFVVLIISFVTPFIISIIYFVFVGGLSEYFQAVFGSTVGYVGYKNTFIIPQGLLIGKILCLSIFLLILFIKRRNLSLTNLFICSWLGFSLFNSFFSQRPYTHYLLMLIPVFSLLVGQLVNQKNKKVFIYLSAVLIISFTMMKAFNHWSIIRTVKYYNNFTQFIAGTKSTDDYNSFFDKKTVRDNRIAAYINSHKSTPSSLFIWGNTAQLYPLTNTLPPGRFTVAYHISGIPSYEKETRDALLKNPPQFIVIMDDVPRYPYLMYNYTQSIQIQNSTIYERNY